MDSKVQSRDILVISALAVTTLLIPIGSYIIYEVALWEVSTIIVGVFVVALILEEHRRMQERHEEIIQSVNDVYKQTDALISVRSELEIDQSLPTARGWAASPDFLREIMETIRDRSPGQIVEAGSGLSTIIIAQALKKYETGKTIALENEAEFAEDTRSYVKHHNVEDYAAIMHTPIKEYIIGQETYHWYDIEELSDARLIDLLIIDGPPALRNPHARYPALPLLWEQLSSGALILVDDGDRKGEKNVIKKWCKKYDLKERYLPLEKGAYLLKSKA